MSDKPELLHLNITQYGSDAEGKIALLIDGFSKQEQVDFVLAQFNKFMADVASEVKQ